MNIDSAIKLIDDAVSQLHLTREQHINLQTAMDLVRVCRQEFKRLKEKEMVEETAKTPIAPEEKTPIDNNAGTPVS